MTRWTKVLALLLVAPACSSSARTDADSTSATRSALRGAATQPAPDLPRGTVETTVPEPPRAVQVAAGGDIQAAITQARNGAAVVLLCGATYSGNYTLPDRGADTSWVDIRPSCYAALPPPGTRMTPTRAAQLQLPKIIAAGGQPAFTAATGANHYRLVGVEITPEAAYQNTLLAFGSDAQTVLATIPRALIVDRSYLHGSATGQLRRSVALNSAWTAIVDSWLSDNHEVGADNQAVMGWTGPGPYLIRNNYLEAGAEVIMFGGGDPLIRGLVPCDISVLGNHITRPVSWKGTNWQIKNLFELKNACRVLVEGNVMENNWAAAQSGDAVLFKSTNQGNTCPWCGTSHVTFRRNVVRNTGGAFNLVAMPDNPADPMHDVSMTDNVVANLRTEVFTGRGAAWLVQQNIARTTIAHNTAVNATPMAALILGPFGTPPMQQLRFTDNVSTSADANYGIYGDNTGLGNAALEVYAPDGVVTGNVFGSMTQRSVETYRSIYPPGNAFATSTGPLGFVDSTIVQRLDSVSVADLLAAIRLRPGSTYAGTATDGRDPGADIAAVQAATAGAISGVWTTTPPTPTPTPVPPVVALTPAQLAAAITALQKASGPSGRENTATRAALAPVLTYLQSLAAPRARRAPVPKE